MSTAAHIAALVPMRRLLDALGFVVDEQRRRCACILHAGSNPSAFAWTNAGLWKCHSCGAGGDKVALVREAKRCSFREAVEFLAVLAGVEYRAERVSRGEIERAKMQRDRLERVAWAVRDEAIRVFSYFRDGLHRSEHLMAGLRQAPDAGSEEFWERVSRLAAAQTFFLAAYTLMCHASREMIVRFAIASRSERRAIILEGRTADEQRAAAQCV